MYRKVLSPLDGTKEFENVIPLIKREIAPDTEIILLKVNRPVGSLKVGDQVILGSQRQEAERAEALNYLRSVARNERDLGQWRCEAIVDRSSSDSIVDFAKQEGVDLIAMYIKERSGLTALMKGNTWRGVKRKASTEVRTFSLPDLERYPREEALAGSAPQPRLKTLADVEIHQDETPTLTPGMMRNADLFKLLPADQIESVASLAERRSVAAGATLGEESGPGQNLFIIVKGEVRLIIISAVGEIAVRVAGPGESFPVAALFGGGALITEGRAITDLDVLAIPRSSLLVLCSKNPVLGMNVYKAAGEIFAKRYDVTLGELSLSVQRELNNEMRGATRIR